MPLRTHVGQIASAIESGKRAAASIDYGPIKGLDIVQTNNSKFIADWQNDPIDPSLFVFGIDNWASPALKVTK